MKNYPYPEILRSLEQFFHVLKRKFLLLLIVTDDLGNLLLSNNFEAVCNANNLALKSRVRKRSSAPCSPTSAWNSDAQYCIFNTKFWAKLGICEISDSKNFGFSATSSGTGKKVSDFFLQNPKTFNNFLSDELSDVFELPKLKSWDRFEKGRKKKSSP